MQVATGYPEPVLKLRDLLNTYLDPEKVAVVLRAFEVGDTAHQGQTRITGEPYILHPVAVAQILANMRMDHESIAAAILHDTIEDTPLAKEDITQHFGDEIAELVDGVTKLDKMKHAWQHVTTIAQAHRPGNPGHLRPDG
jgi:(p)ppGpp synthase/HD superfamily hydrolase